MVFYYFTLLLLLFAAGGQANIDCHADVNGRNCIFVSTEELGFNDAESSCREMEMHLVTILSREMQTFVQDQLDLEFGLDGAQYWIGLHWSHHVLRWTSPHRSVPVTFWKTAATEHIGRCISTAKRADPVHAWESVDCDQKLTYICGRITPDKPSNPLNLTSFECPDHFVNVGKSCFSVVTDYQRLRSWKNASVACTNLYPGANLASVPSSYEQDTLTALMADQPVPVWIGLSETEGQHSWLNNDPVVFTNWNDHEPSIKNNCTSMSNLFRELGAWNQANCSHELGYICEIAAWRTSVDHPKLLGDIFHQGRCDDGFYEYHGVCLGVFHPHDDTDGVTRSATSEPDSASQLCNALAVGESDGCKDGLATASCPVVIALHTHAEAAFARLLVRKFAVGIDTVWVGVKLTDQFLKLDGPVLDGQSNLVDFGVLYDHMDSIANTSTFTVCLALNESASLLVAPQCTTKMPALCGYYLDEHVAHPNMATNTTGLSCPKYWREFGNKCYLVVTGQERNWAAAEAYCQNGLTSVDNGLAHLVSVSGQGEQSFLATLPIRTPYWLGLKMFGETATTAAQTIEFIWSDASDVMYLAFAPGNFPTGSDLERCVRLADTSRHNWTTVPCTDKNDFICEVHMADIQKTTDKLASNCLIESTGEYCLQFNEKRSSFMESERSCQSRQRHLATVVTENEQEFLMQVLKHRMLLQEGNRSPGRFWIGLHVNDGHFMWTSSYPALPIAYWMAYHTGINHNCVYVDQGADGVLSWGTTRCSAKLQSICSSVPTILEPEPETAKTLTCPPDFVLFGENCFSLPSKAGSETTFVGAIEACKLQKGHLAVITNAIEQDLLSVLLSASMKPVWIGLKQHYGLHSWVNNASVVFTDWMSGQPIWNAHVVIFFLAILDCPSAHYSFMQYIVWH